MSGRPILSVRSEGRHTGGYLVGTASTRDRMLPTPGRIARRRILITVTKWILPMAAMGLLALIALWPEISRTAAKARLSMAHVSGELDGGKLIDARYNGV
ncbi:MAG: lipopolysaccharide export system protein LptC, partial [Acetobacteraceae bacterium]|nr:lipopolysaccharide export system protein LptC [Acetobacteraceae bacterium]